jgi:hypothetical protein
MQRAFELMCTRALEREAFGSRLADKQTVQDWIANSAAEIQACRLLALDAEHMIDAGNEARVEISAPEVLRRAGAARRDRPCDPDARRWIDPRPTRPSSSPTRSPNGSASRRQATRPSGGRAGALPAATPLPRRRGSRSGTPAAAAPA